MSGIHADDNVQISSGHGDAEDQAARERKICGVFFNNVSMINGVYNIPQENAALMHPLCPRIVITMFSGWFILRKSSIFTQRWPPFAYRPFGGGFLLSGHSLVAEQIIVVLEIRRVEIIIHAAQEPYAEGLVPKYRTVLRQEENTSTYRGAVR